MLFFHNNPLLGGSTPVVHSQWQKTAHISEPNRATPQDKQCKDGISIVPTLGRSHHICTNISTVHCKYYHTSNHIHPKAIAELHLHEAMQASRLLIFKSTEMHGTIPWTCRYQNLIKAVGILLAEQDSG